MRVVVTKTLVHLPEDLRPGMRIKSGKGTFAVIMRPRIKNKKGEQLYRLKYKVGPHVIRSGTLWTRDDLFRSGCRLCVK